MLNRRNQAPHRSSLGPRTNLSVGEKATGNIIHYHKGQMIVGVSITSHDNIRDYQFSAANVPPELLHKLQTGSEVDVEIVQSHGSTKAHCKLLNVY